MSDAPAADDGPIVVPTERLAEEVRKWFSVLAPPPSLTVSEWADKYRQLSSEDTAAAGQWRTSDAEYLRGIMDAVNDPLVEEIVLVKPAQVGGTAALMNIVGYFVDQDPSPVMWVTVSLGEAEVFARDRFEPFRRDNPRIAAKIGDPKSRDSGNTILDKQFVGGRLLFRGANSAPSLRSHPIRVVIMDEVDGYPPTTSEGEPTKLAQKRATAFWNRKIVKCSTPGDKRTSRVWAAYEKSDRRRFLVPCPKCGERQPLEWGGPAAPYGVKFETDEDGRCVPGSARYLCRHEACGHRWTDVERWDAVRSGKWEPERPGGRVAGFWLNEIYSPFKRMEETAGEFLDAKDDPSKLKEWQQQAMAEPWEQRGDAPDWEMLYRRRVDYPLGVVPDLGGCPPFSVLSAAADTQDDRLEVGIYGWNRRKQSVLVDYRVIWGDTREQRPWDELDELLAREWPHASGAALPIRCMCVDRGGHRAPMVDAFAGRHPQPLFDPRGVYARRPRTVVATVGSPTGWNARVLGAQPLDKAKKRRPALIVTLGANYLKSEITTQMRQPWPSDEMLREGAEYPLGAHFVSTDTGERYFRQLCAEELVTVRDRGVMRQKFVARAGERNEALDVMAMARGAAHMAGVDHFRDDQWRGFEAMVASPAASPPKGASTDAPSREATEGRAPSGPANPFTGRGAGRGFR